MKKKIETVYDCGGIQHEPLMPPIDTVELVFILDRSGSMAGLESDTVGGFNSMIEKQKKQDGRCFVTTVLFDGKSEILHDRICLADLPTMTGSDYTPRGCTALIDAIGSTIEHIAGIHRYARPEDLPKHTMFVITTDGQENSSHSFTAHQVKAMIEQKKEECGWEFLFIGANIDAIKTAGGLGIDSDRAVNYNADTTGTCVLYETVAEAVSQVRDCGELSPGWSDDICADYKKRGGK